MSIVTLMKLWNSFWFAPTSPAAICLFRIVLGILLFTSSVMWIPDAQTFFGPQAMLSERTIDIFHGSNHFSLIFFLPRTEMVVNLLIFTLVFSSVCLTVGLHTRASALTAFICLVSLHHRNPVILNSGDTLLRILCFLLIFSPAGKMFSIDALNKNQTEKSSSLDGPPWAQRLLQIQIVALYCQAFWCKAAGNDWVDGSAVFYATHLAEYVRLPIPFLLDNEFTIRLLTWGAMATEFALWALIWIKEFRYPVLLAGVALHLGIEWTMNIPLFELITMATYIVFLQPQHVMRFMACFHIPQAPGLLFRQLRIKPIK